MKPLMLNAAKSARYLGITTRNFHRWRNDDLQPALPKPVMRSSNPFFIVSELDAFVAQLMSLREPSAK